MSIILNEEEDSLKYDLLKQSLRDQVGYKINKNQSFSTPRQTFYYTKFPPRFSNHQISDWNNDSEFSPEHQSKVKRFILPEMKHRRKSKNIEQLSRELLKYEQFNSDENTEHKNLRLVILKQMTKINFKRQSPIKQAQSPKKVNIKLQFPKRYERYQLQNQQKKEKSSDDICKNHMTEDMTGSSYAMKASRGLIPSIKKLVSSSFPKKSIFRSESERDPYQKKKLIMSKQDWVNAKKSITDEIQQKFMQQEKGEKEKKVRLGRLERRLPINFLSYSHRKHSIEKQEDNIQEGKKRKKSPYLSQLPNTSFYVKAEKGNIEEQVYEHRRLNECIFLNVKKKKEQA